MMNKRFFGIFIGVMFLFNASVFAQATVHPGIIVGLSMFKYTVSSASQGGSYEPDSKTGLVAGGVLDIAVSKIFSIEPGIVYSMRGAYSEMSGINYDTNFQPYAYTAKYSLNAGYLAIPVHAKLKYPGIPNIDPYVLAGLNLGFLLSANIHAEETGYPTIDSNITSQMNTVDFGFDVGVGVEFSLQNVIPFVEFVYYKGLVNVNNNQPGDDSFVTNKGIEIKGGLKFKM